jgi:hypothetical protein
MQKIEVLVRLYESNAKLAKALVDNGMSQPEGVARNIQVNTAVKIFDSIAEKVEYLKKAVNLGKVTDDYLDQEIKIQEINQQNLNIYAAMSGNDFSIDEAVGLINTHNAMNPDQFSDYVNEEFKRS